MEPRGEHLRALAVLPARLGSTRLPRKVLLAETGQPLVVHTARAVARATSIESVLIATDDETVATAVREFGFEAALTSPDHPSGTDRVHEAVSASEGRWDVVVNVQADEPELDPGDLDLLVHAFADPAVHVATLAAPITDPTELCSESVVKVVRDALGDALYFSRAPIPNRSHARPNATEAPEEPRALRHVGVYAFRPAALAEFCALEVGTLERSESLEQLRWLEAGRRMRVLDARRAPRGIDTEADYRAFVERVGHTTSPNP